MFVMKLCKIAKTKLRLSSAVTELGEVSKTEEQVKNRLFVTSGKIL